MEFHPQDSNERFVIYHKETTLFLEATVPAKRTYKSEAAAKAALTRAVRDHGINRDEYAVAEAVHFYSNIEKHETKRNLMSGKEFTQGVNTPHCCDPSAETYWCM